MGETPTAGARFGAVLGAAVAVALLSAGVANAADPAQLKSRLGNWCLDGPNGADTAAVVNPCDGSPSQRWVPKPSGQIESAAFPGNCIGIGSAADETPVLLSRCQPTDTQRWTHRSDGKIVSALGPCLNIFGGVARPGTPVIAYHDIPGVEDEEWDSVG